MSMIIARWTIEEYHHMIEAEVLNERQVELLRGEIVEMPPEGKPHAYWSHEASDYLSVLFGKRASIRQAKPITLPNDSEPEPDIAVVQRLGREYLEHHPYPENIFWLIEYANSSLEKDLEVSGTPEFNSGACADRCSPVKTKIYAEANIPEYWVVNLKKLHLVVFRNPLDGDYATKFTLSNGTVKPLAFPDVTVTVEQIINQ